MTEFWFDTRAGKMIAGEAAYEAAVVESLPGDIVSLPELLVAPDFPYQIGDFIDRRRRHDWTTQEKLQLGSWVLKLLEAAAGEPRMLKTEPHFERLHILGLAPSTKMFAEFGSFSTFRELIGSPIEERGEYGIYANWSVAEFVDYARQVESRVGRKPGKRDYESENGPSHQMIVRRVGGIGRLNEYLGYPNVPEWDRDDYIIWGTKVVAANGGQFSSWHVQVLSRRNRGPGLKTVYSNVSTWSKYEREVIQAYEYERNDAAVMHQQKLDNYKQMLEIGSLPKEYGELDEIELLRRTARYQVIQDCIPTMTEYNKRLLAANSVSLIPALRKVKPGLTAGQIEMVAVSRGVFDDIWPIDSGLDYLKVSDDELAAVRARRAEIKRRADIKRRALLRNAA